MYFQSVRITNNKFKAYIEGDCIAGHSCTLDLKTKVDELNYAE